MERWIVIEDHPNYEVSNEGKVRNRRTGRILRPVMNRGYERVNLDGQLCYIHKLVMEAFRGELCNGLKVHHIDGDVGNNDISNLKLIGSGYISNVSTPRINIVRCRDCIHRYDFDICEDKDDDFYCGYGKF